MAANRAQMTRRISTDDHSAVPRVVRLAVPDHEYVAILDDVLLAFEPQLTLVPRARVAAQVYHRLPIDHFGADELLLEIGVDGARRLHRGALHRDGPGAAFVL